MLECKYRTGFNLGSDVGISISGSYPVPYLRMGEQSQVLLWYDFFACHYDPPVNNEITNFIAINE